MTCARYIARIGDMSAAYGLTRRMDFFYSGRKSVELMRYGDYLEDDSGGLVSFGPALSKDTLIGLFPAIPTFLSLSESWLEQKTA